MWAVAARGALTRLRWACTACKRVPAYSLYICIYNVYIYIERERERDNFMYVYIFV